MEGIVVRLEGKIKWELGCEMKVRKSNFERVKRRFFYEGKL